MLSTEATTDSGSHSLVWSGRVLAEQDLLQNLNGHMRVVVTTKTVITPLAWDYLRNQGVEIDRDCPAETTAWGVGQDRPYPMVHTAVSALRKSAMQFKSMPMVEGRLPCRWAQALAECVAAGQCHGGVIFCEDPALISCVANKVPGLRAAPVLTIGAVARAMHQLQANLLAVEMPGRTWFEIREILRMACTNSRACPEGLAATLKELEANHANR